MPLRRTVGISLACLVTSACVAAETSEISASHSRAIPPGALLAGSLTRGSLPTIAPGGGTTGRKFRARRRCVQRCPRSLLPPGTGQWE